MNITMLPPEPRLPFSVQVSRKLRSHPHYLYDLPGRSDQRLLYEVRSSALKFLSNAKRREQPSVTIDEPLKLQGEVGRYKRRATALGKVLSHWLSGYISSNGSSDSLVIVSNILLDTCSWLEIWNVSKR